MADQTSLHMALVDAIVEADLLPDQVLVVLARLLGYMVSVQDLSVYTQEAVMMAVSENMSIGGSASPYAGETVH